VAAAVDAALNTGRRAGYGSDDAFDRGTAHRARGHGGRRRGTAHRPTHAAYRAVDDTHDYSLIICCLGREADPAEHHMAAVVYAQYLQSSWNQHDTANHL
jgi:hypothetical protein